MREEGSVGGIGILGSDGIMRSSPILSMNGIVKYSVIAVGRHR